MSASFRLSEIATRTTQEGGDLNKNGWGQGRCKGSHVEGKGGEGQETTGRVCLARSELG